MRTSRPRETFVYGERFTGLPTILDPKELLDGTVVSGDYSTACFRNTTYLQHSRSSSVIAS